jgi:acyl carrier protein
MNTGTKLQAIFEERFNIKINKEDFSKNLSLSAKGIGLNAIALLYLIHYVEADFNIRFTREHFKSGILRTLPGLYATIEELRKTKSFESCTKTPIEMKN